MVASEAMAQTPPPATGDWDISDTTVLSDQQITVQGNVNVLRGGSLSLTNVDLRIDLPSDGAYNIEVASGGTMTLDRVTIDSADGSSVFNFTILGTATIGGTDSDNSIIRRMDGATAPNPLVAPQGLVVRSSSVLVYNTTIERCRGFAIAVMPSGLSDITPVFQYCTIRNNGGGMYCGGLIVSSGDAVVRNCDFYANGLGELIAIAAAPYVTGCTFGAFLSFSATGVSAAALAEPTIVDCDFSWIGSAINSVLANIKVRGGSVAACGAGVNVIGGNPTITGLSIDACPVPMVLNSTTATLADCSISGFVTPGYAVSIDGGRPTLKGFEIDLALMGGGIRIINSSRAIIDACNISVTSNLDAISVDRSTPSIKDCLVEGAQDGIDLTWSAAAIEGCTIQDNSGWGIIARFERPTVTNNRFGTGNAENVDGRILYIFHVTVYVEFENGTAANNTTVTATNDIDVEVLGVVTDETGYAFDEMLPEYVLTNENQAIQYAPYRLLAMLDDLINMTSIEIGTNPNITLVLRPIPNDPPMVEITSPVEGIEYNAWDYPDGIPVCGTAVDPEDGPLEKYWSLWTMGLPPEPDPLQLDPGTWQMSLSAVDSKGQQSIAWVNFTVVAVPPERFGIAIVLPADGFKTSPGRGFDFGADLAFDENPYLNITAPPNVTWWSDIEGELPIGRTGSAALLELGTHEIFVNITPMHPQFHPEAYIDSVTVEVIAPVVVAHISLPEDGTSHRDDVPINLSARGSNVIWYNDPTYEVLYKWSSSISGSLGQGKELSIPALPLGVHTISLNVTTEPYYYLFDIATVTITVQHVTPPNNPPVAMIELLSESLVEGEPVNLSASSSSDPDDDPLSYLWDLGDGNTSTEMEPSHAYESPGNYTIRLTVTDERGLEANVEVTIEVLKAEDPGLGPGPGPGPGPGDGDDDGPRDPNEEFYGWLFLLILIVLLVAMILLAYRGRRREEI
jgi:PKD repeat protein